LPFGFFGMQRFLTFCLLMLLLAAPSPSAEAADRPAESPKAVLRVAFGVLQKHKTSEGDDQYVLVDKDGQIRYSIDTDKDLPLEANLGKPVQVVGEFDAEAESDKPLLVAQRIEPKTAPPPQVAGVRIAASQDSQTLPPLTPIPSPGSSGSPGTSEPSTRGSAEPLIISDEDLAEGPSLNAPGLIESPDDSQLITPQRDPWHVAPCGPPEWLWGQVSALAWWTKGMPLPELVTTSPTGTPQAQAGVIGAEGTEVLFGDRDYFTEARLGGQFRIGGWLGQRRWVGLELDYTGLEDERAEFLAASVGDQILARPFFNVGTNTLTSDSALVAYPNLIAGTIYIEADSQFQMAGAHLITNILCNFGAQCNGRAEGGGCSSGLRVDLLGGYRYIGLDEGVLIRETLVTTVTPRTGFQAYDQFTVNNDFHGGELGLSAKYRGNRWWTEGLLEVALGRTQAQTRIAGQTLLIVPPDAEDGDATVMTGDLLALTTNIGQYSTKSFAWAPQIAVTFGYQLSPQLSVKAGYSGVFLSRVLRPDGVIDLGVNEMYIPDPTEPDLAPTGPARPAAAFNETTYWAHGFNLGLDYRW